MAELITSATLRELVGANMVCSAFVVGEHGGYSVTVKYGVVERVLGARSKDNQVAKRTFPSLDAVDTFLRTKIHLSVYTVNSANYETAPLKPRALKAQAQMQQLHKAAAHTTWLRKEVEASRADTRPAVSHADAKQQFAANLERLRLEGQPAVRKSATRKKPVVT